VDDLYLLRLKFLSDYINQNYFPVSSAVPSSFTYRDFPPAPVSVPPNFIRPVQSSPLSVEQNVPVINQQRQIDENYIRPRRMQRVIQYYR
jgi:hypothetical protein